MASNVRKSFAVLSLCVALVLAAWSVAWADSQEVMVPMRDGAKLATNVFTPSGTGPWPVVLSRTPYLKGDVAGGERREASFLGNGYVRVVQDVRGKGGSEGQYRAFTDDMNDGYDTVEWIAKQPWSNGKVGMTGGSALGITANHAAMACPPHLVCNYVTVGHGSSFHYSSYPGGVFLQNLSEEWLRRQGVPPSGEPRPLNRVYDDSYARLDIHNYFSRMTTPTLNVGGWYDIFGQGNIDCFTGLQYSGGTGAKGNQRLVMGAFGHGRLSGDLKYAADAGRPEGDMQMRWFDHWLKGVENGIEREPAVRYYVMGDTFDLTAPGNQWRTSDVWPPKSDTTPYYCQPGHKLSKARPTASPGSPGASDTYTYDPQDPVPSVGGNNLMMELGPMDQRKVSARSDVVKYETDPLTEAVEIVGRVFAELAVSTDAQDTDFMVKLIDVHPNGYEALMLDQAFRLRYYDGNTKMSRVEKNKVYPIKVDLWSTALVFNKGHKIAIHVSSSNSPRFEKHSNTWEPVKSYDDAVKATNTVHHNTLNASRVMLPVTKVYSSATASTGN